MKKTILTTTLSIFFITFCSADGPILKEKLTNPEEYKRQTLQKRSFIWIDGQWEVDNNTYKWVSGHWVPKRMGYVFINGTWEKKSNGWTWKEGYWKKINMNKWINLYS